MTFLGIGVGLHGNPGQGGVDTGTPPSSMAGNVFNLDATVDATVIRDASENVSQWNDTSVSALQVTQSTVSSQPVHNVSKKAVNCPSKMATMNIPAIGGTKRWVVGVVRINFAQLASADGTVAYLNSSARNPMIAYVKSGKFLQVQWRTSAAINYTLQWAAGVAAGFVDNMYVPFVAWLDEANLLLKGYLGKEALQTVAITGTATNASATGILMDFRAGWSDVGIRALSVGTDVIDEAKAQKLLRWAQIHADEANAAGS